MRFKTAFNEQVAEFQSVAERLSRLVEDFTQIRTFDAPEAPGSAEERERRDRIIQSPDQRVPHGLDEAFRYKRPAVFTLDGVPFDGTHTWSQVYETLCRHLAKQKPAVFARFFLMVKAEASRLAAQTLNVRFVEHCCRWELNERCLFMPTAACRRPTVHVCLGALCGPRVNMPYRCTRRRCRSPQPSARTRQSSFAPGAPTRRCSASA